MASDVFKISVCFWCKKAKKDDLSLVCVPAKFFDGAEGEICCLPEKTVKVCEDCQPKAIKSAINEKMDKITLKLSAEYRVYMFTMFLAMQRLLLTDLEETIPKGLQKQYLKPLIELIKELEFQIGELKGEKND